MSSTHNHCFSHHHYQAWCHQIFFVNNTKIFVTPSVLKLQKWFLHHTFDRSQKESLWDLMVLDRGTFNVSSCNHGGRIGNLEIIISTAFLLKFIFSIKIDVANNVWIFTTGYGISLFVSTWPLWNIFNLRLDFCRCEIKYLISNRDMKLGRCSL